MPVPILRSPPFPHVRPDIATVSRATGEQPWPSVPPERIADIFGRIRDARIGGSFWAPPPPVNGITAVVAPRSAAEMAGMLAGLGPAERVSPLLLLPRGVRAPRQAGTTHAARDVDPWPLLDAGVPLHIHGDDELAALACIAGVDARLHSSGRFAAVADSAADRAAHIAGLLLHGTDYRDPFGTGAQGIESCIERLALWRGLIDANRGIAAIAGIAWWKRAEIDRFLWAPRVRPLRLVRSPAQVRRATSGGGALAIWPSRVPARMLDGGGRNLPIVRIEDGFVRSVGLGSNLFPPFSIVVDREGIHYDPDGPSELEQILETASFPPALIARAEALQRFIVEAGISKYGAAAAPSALPERAPSRRLLLVPGQVEDDQSVLRGGGAVHGNLDLIRRVRVTEPDAEIWFRPHPDVDAGHRRGAVAEEEALRHADRVVRGGSMAALLDMVDGVHTLTSLTGFEALLRGRDVTCHGTPFYAGWGLTRDLGTIPARRARRLTLAQLVAGVLILYPRYLDPVTRLPCPPEVLVDRFAAGLMPRASLLTWARAVQGAIMRRPSTTAHRTSSG